VSLHSVVSCGAGAFLNHEINDCELCPIGSYLRESAASRCRRCPPGTTTLDEGANDEALCIGEGLLLACTAVNTQYLGMSLPGIYVSRYPITG